MRLPDYGQLGFVFDLYPHQLPDHCADGNTFLEESHLPFDHLHAHPRQSFKAKDRLERTIPS